MGTNEIYDRLVDLYYNTILKYCNAKLKNEADAKDCTQEVFLTLLEKIDKIKITENISNWLYKAANIEMKAYKRKNIQHEKLKENLLVDPFDTQEENQIKSLLDIEDYNLLTDFYILGKSVDEISRELRISISAVYKKINRVKMKLIDMLEFNKNYL